MECVYESLDYKIIIISGNKKSEITGNHTKLIESFLKKCNGYLTVLEIINECNFDNDLGLEIAKFSFEEDWICDSRELFKEFFMNSINPTKYSRDISLDDILSIPQKENVLYDRENGFSGNSDIPYFLEKALNSRQSCRSFDGSRKISKSQLFSILFSMTQVNGNRCVPSAGGMYSLEVFCFVLKQIDEIPVGLYIFDSKSGLLHLWNNNKGDDYISNDWLERLIGSKSFVRDSSAILLIAGNTLKVSQKYSNRSLRYTFLEAGHMIQNAIIYCSLENLGCVEIGGFDDKVAFDIVGNQDLLPHTTLVVGIPNCNENEGQEFVTESFLYSDFYVGKDKLIKETKVLDLVYNNEYKTPLTSVVSYYSVEGKVSSEYKAFGKSTLLAEAYVKSIAEGVERSVSSTIWWDTKEQGINLINPKKILSYHEDFYKNKGILDFLEHQDKFFETVHCTRKIDDDIVPVPVDLVFYGFNQEKLGRNLLGFSSSTGVSAHCNVEQAFESAFLELIERDAISILWYCKRVVSKIPKSMWSTSVLKRSEIWNKYGFNTYVLDITVDSVCVVLVLIVNKLKHPYLVSGCSASFSFKSSIYKAFNEAELMLLTWQDEKVDLEMDESKVETPEDYGVFYMNPKNLQKVDWLINSKEMIVKADEVSLTLEDLIKKFDPIWVNMNKGKKKPLSVVRVLSEKLMPLNFSHGCEPYYHKRPFNLSMKWARKYPSLPHFFS